MTIEASLISATAEETKDASRVIPLAISFSVGLNIILVFIVSTTLIFCIGDLESVQNTPTGVPFIQLYYNATQSYATTNAMVAVLVILVVACGVNEVATSSRQLWCGPLLVS